MTRQQTSDVRRWFVKSVEDLWPIAIGSLSLRKSPCIRKNCQACASGEGHSSHALYGKRGSDRFVIYIPERLVPEVRLAIANGHLLQQLLRDAGVRYINALKKQEGKGKRSGKR
jgi:hypothetical protein